jgi:NAD(P)-dependent dehydrogenase (short-subunit alcohol dehydrogenase family)
MKIEGLSALVTGGASGLGAACARMIITAGGHATIVDVNEEAGRAFAADTGATFVRADVTKAADIEQAIAGIEKLSIAINCAGIGISQRTISKEGPASLDAFARVVTINLIGSFNVARLAAWKMSTNQPNEGGERGVIINTASVAAFDGQIGQAAYSASKGGVAGMTLPMARDLSKLGIRVVTIAPGIFDTPMLAALPDYVRASLGASVPFPSRLGKPDEYGSLARHIIENAMLNGEVIRLDGALRMAPK